MVVKAEELVLTVDLDAASVWLGHEKWCQFPTANATLKRHEAIEPAKVRPEAPKVKSNPAAAKPQKVAEAPKAVKSGKIAGKADGK